MRRTVLAFAALIALSACGRASSYPAQYRENFMTSCQLNGASEAVCGCVWARVETEIPVADFEAADAALTSGQPHPMSERVAAYRAACMAAP